ncbi:glycine receptor subunit alpha-1-like isoform X2 [Ptychodera flava]|uniref:glycine receptor subunit alpha-1-like isoform X2 n=1 Tax=Ptychodera flava TaxID=63121 RepID=UPI003969F17A
MSSKTMLVLGTVLAMFVFSAVSSGNKRYKETLYSVIKDEDYDPELRPNAGGPPVNISVFVYITSIHSLSEVSMDYGATLVLSLQWDDPRFAFNGTEDIDLRSGSKLVDKIWTPDLYFVNVKEGKLHEITMSNKHMRIMPAGRILYDMRVSLILICHLHLHRFPMDRQRCGLEIESFGYTIRDMQLDWDPHTGVVMAPEVTMSEFNVGDPNNIKTTVEYPAVGKFDKLTCSFSLHRQLIFYVMEHYAPSFLLVILSWVSFWLSVEATPARASLGITTALTLTTLSSSARAQMARVSYTKAIDIWMLVCLIFVFAALLEFAVASYLAKHTEAIYSSDSYSESSIPLRHLELKEYTSVRPELLRNDLRINMDDVRPESPREARRRSYKRLSRTIDKYSRGFFPLAFLFFNSVYWPFYLHNYYDDDVDVH